MQPSFSSSRNSLRAPGTRFFVIKNLIVFSDGHQKKLLWLCGSPPWRPLAPAARSSSPARTGWQLPGRARGPGTMAWLPTAQEGLWVWAPHDPNQPLQAAHAYDQAWKRLAAAARIIHAVQQWRQRSHRRQSHRVACAMRYLQEPVNRSALTSYGHAPQVRTPEVGFTRTGPLRDSNAPTLSYYPTIYIQDQPCRATGHKRPLRAPPIQQRSHFLGERLVAVD